MPNSHNGAIGDGVFWLLPPAVILTDDDDGDADVLVAESVGRSSGGGV